MASILCFSEIDTLAPEAEAEDDEDLDSFFLNAVWISIAPPRLGDDKTGLGAFLHVCSHSRCDIESIYMYHVACLYTAYTYIFILALASIKTGRSQHLRSREA